MCYKIYIYIYVYILVYPKRMQVLTCARVSLWTPAGGITWSSPVCIKQIAGSEAAGAWDGTLRGSSFGNLPHKLSRRVFLEVLLQHRRSGTVS